MANELLNRRQLLIGVSAGAVGIGAVALSPITGLASSGPGLVGTWDVMIHDLTAPGGPTTVEGATTFAPGGGLASMDSNGPSTGIGSWASGEDGTFRARFMQFAFSPTLPTSKLLVNIKGRLVEGESIRGTFTYKVYDLHGVLLFGTGKGTFTGKRFAA